MWKMFYISNYIIDEADCMLIYYSTKYKVLKKFEVIILNFILNVKLCVQKYVIELLLHHMISASYHMFVEIMNKYTILNQLKWFMLWQDIV